MEELDWSGEQSLNRGTRLYGRSTSMKTHRSWLQLISCLQNQNVWKNVPAVSFARTQYWKSISSFYYCWCQLHSGHRCAQCTSNCILVILFITHKKGLNSVFIALHCTRVIFLMLLRILINCCCCSRYKIWFRKRGLEPSEAEVSLRGCMNHANFKSCASWCGVLSFLL